MRSTQQILFDLEQMMDGMEDEHDALIDGLKATETADVPESVQWRLVELEQGLWETGKA